MCERMSTAIKHLHTTPADCYTSGVSDPASHLEYATAGGYRHKSVDLEDAGDRKLVRRFPVRPEVLRLAVDVAEEHLRNPADPDHASYIGHVVAMERVNQIDEHKAAERDAEAAMLKSGGEVSVEVLKRLRLTIRSGYVQQNQEVIESQAASQPAESPPEPGAGGAVEGV